MKIQNRYFLFAVLSVLVAVVGMAWLSVGVTTDAGKVAAWMVIAAGFGPFTYNISNAFLWASRARRFKGIFGVNPPNDPRQMDWKVREALQPIVDECLKSQAFCLQDAYDAENVILKKKPENLGQAIERSKAIATQAVSVDIDKKYFWSWRNLAWEWGFEVWCSHTDYTSALDRAGKEKIKKQF